MPWPTMHVTEPAAVRICDGEVFVDVRCGDETVRFALSPHMLLATLEAARREYERWQRSTGCVLPMFGVAR